LQTTLLGLAIAIILALVAALVAPLVVDWNQYRSAFENEAGRLTGLTVRVNGTIEARILPTPAIKLHNVDVGALGREPQVEAGTIALEVALGSLLRGEVRVTELHVVAPRISLGLEQTGAIDWPASQSPSPRLDALMISRFSVEDGRVTLTEAGSGSHLVLEKVWFSGDVRSLLGAFKGEGTFVAGDQRYGYRVSASRLDAGGLKLRLGVDPSDRPLTTEIDGALTFSRGVPQFDGTLAMARPVGVTLAGGERVMSDPWRLGGRLLATPASASLQDLTLHYGAEERAIELSGKAAATFGARPHLDGAITARQVDIDRARAAPEATHRPPFALIKSFVDGLVAAVKPPLPVAVGVAIDALTVGGTTLQSLHGDVRFDDEGWSLNGVEFRAPGLTAVSLSGRLANTAHGLAFSGPARLQSADLTTLVAWLEGRSDRLSGATKTLTAQGDVTIASDRLALDRLKATVDQENIQGRFGYIWAKDDRPAVIDGEIHAATIDVDALLAFARTVSDGNLQIPREISLDLDVGRVTFADIDARKVDARVKIDAGVLHIDRLSVGDLGGAAFNISGRIDELSSQPRGKIMLDLDANALAGLCSVVGRFAPQTADGLRRFADRLAPAKVHGELTVDRGASASSDAKFDLGGRLGALSLALNGDVTGEPKQPGSATLRINSRLDADDGAALVRLLGLDGVLAVDQLPGQLTLSAEGTLGGDVRVSALAAAGGFFTTADGILQLGGDDAPAGKLQMKASAADLRPLHRAMTGQPGPTVPATASATITMAGASLLFSDMAIAAGATALRGRVGVKLSTPAEIDGDVAGSDVDVPVLLTLLMGLPAAAPGSGAAWSGAPLGAGAFMATNGSVNFKFERASVTPSLSVHDLTGVARFAPSQIGLSSIDGALAGGHLTGDLALRRDANALTAHGQVELAGADAAKLLSSEKNAVDGLLTLKLQGETIGASPHKLIGAIQGGGTVTLNNAHFTGIDAAAFDAAIRSADRSGTIDAGKIRSAVSAAMDNGRLAVPKGQAELTIAAGQVRVGTAMLQAQGGAALSIAGLVDLATVALDARLTLSEPPPANALVRTPPVLTINVKGPLAAPERTLDVSELVSWLTLRAAELQTRRLESIEANTRGEVAGPAMRPPSPAVRFVSPGTAVESAPLAANGAVIAAPATIETNHPPAQLPSAVPDSHRDSSNADSEPAALPGAGDLAPKPPQPPSRTNNSTTANAGSAEPPRQSATPPAPRSPFDFLFRSQH